MTFAEYLQKFLTAHHGHHQIDHQQAGRRIHGIELIERISTVFGFANVIPALPKGHAHELSDVFVVFHEEDGLHTARIQLAMVQRPTVAISLAEQG